MEARNMAASFAQSSCQTILRDIILKTGLSYESLAKELKISASTVRSIAQGATQNPVPSTYHRILRLYSVVLLRNKEKKDVNTHA